MVTYSQAKRAAEEAELAVQNWRQVFVRQYLVHAMLNCEGITGNESWSSAAIETAVEDCCCFLGPKYGLLALESYRTAAHKSFFETLKRAAHDFWNTRDRHPIGFDSGMWNVDGYTTDAEALTEIARSFSPLNVVKGEDGALYFATREEEQR